MADEKKPRTRKPKATVIETTSTAFVRVTVPKDCKKRSLSINALDSYTRELANKTIVAVNGPPLFCDSFKVTERGTLLLEIRPECFEISEAAQ